MRRTLSSAALAVFVVLANAATALAQSSGGADPKKIGDNAKNIVASNAKAIWWILLVVGVLSMLTSRKAGRAIASMVLIVVSGIAIYNPNGVGRMMANLADELLT